MVYENTYENTYVVHPDDSKARKYAEQVHGFWDSGFIGPFFFAVLGFAGVFGATEAWLKIVGGLTLTAAVARFLAGPYHVLQARRAKRLVKKGRILKIKPDLMQMIAPHITNEMRMVWREGDEQILAQVFDELKYAIAEYSRAVEVTRGPIDYSTRELAWQRLGHGFNAEISRILSNLQISAVEILRMNNADVRAETHGYQFVRENGL